MDYIVFVIFVVVQIIFIPFAIIGFILVFYKQMYGSKKLGVSSTAIEVINGRWTMAIFGMREDVASVKLNNVLPNNSVLGMWMVLLPSYLMYKISGENRGYPSFSKVGEEGLSNIVISRTAYFDAIIEKSKGNVEQFVIMGAGFDTRCYGDLKKSDLKCFELDQAKTQRLKREHLKKAGVDTAGVNYVEVDFSLDHWYAKLEESGYDPRKKSIFLWEGVTLYLSEEDVRKTLRDIKEHSSEGSVLVCDLYAQSFVTGKYAPGMKSSINALKITDEELGFGIDFSSNHQNALEMFVKSENIESGDAYFMGSKTRKGTYVVVVEVLL